MIVLRSRMSGHADACAAFRIGAFSFHPRGVAAYAIFALAAGCVAAAVLSGAFDWDPSAFGRALTPVGIGLLACLWARSRGMARFVAPIEMSFLLMGTMFLTAFCSVIAAASAVPLVDPLLRSADAMVAGFDRRLFAARASQWPILMAAAQWVYRSLGWTPSLLFCVLAWRGREDRAWSLLTAMLLALIVSVACLALTPAYGSPPYAYRFIEVLDGVRSGALRRFDDAVITGLVTFPSMHAAYGVILARGAALVGPAGIPLLILNVAMIGSALVVGGHYLVDLAAGCMVGFGAIRLARLR